MKLSKPLWALILIVSALLVSGANSVSGSDEKHQNQASAHSHGTDRKASVSPSPVTIIVEPAPVKIIQTTAAVEKKQPQQKWYERPLVTDWGILVVTLLYTAIALGLLRATNAALTETKKAADAAKQSADETKGLVETAARQAKAAEDQVVNLEKTLAATERSANAARDAVRIAQLALDTECPYIWIEPKSVAIRNTNWSGKGFFSLTAQLLGGDADEADATHKNISLSFELRNRGRTIAIIRDVRLRIVEMPVWDWIGSVPIGRGKRRTLTRAKLLNPQPPFVESGESGDCDTWICLVPIDKWRETIRAAINPTVIVRAVYANTAGRSFNTTQRFRLQHSRLYHDPKNRRR